MIQLLALLLSLCALSVYPGEDEEKITFPPTYRYERGSRDCYLWQKYKTSGVSHLSQQRNTTGCLHKMTSRYRTKEDQKSVKKK